MKKIPIIIDCDPGVDDSYALALANSYEGFEILAITAVEGNVPAVITRKNALCIREELGINCRIGFGAEKPLRKEYKQFAADTHGQSGVGSFVFDEP
ncbi:MAG: nucleoside hydrolase [Clostridia bacterium]|nr:nucleoside hydrolase [Clostridia bacterium]